MLCHIPGSSKDANLLMVTKNGPRELEVSPESAALFRRMRLVTNAIANDLLTRQVHSGTGGFHASFFFTGIPLEQDITTTCLGPNV